MTKNHFDGPSSTNTPINITNNIPIKVNWIGLSLNFKFFILNEKSGISETKIKDDRMVIIPNTCHEFNIFIKGSQLQYTCMISDKLPINIAFAGVGSPINELV
jgi:hypothetical protein